jgi:poly(A) polymerase
MRPLWLAAEAQQPSDRAIFRYFKDLGDAGVDVAVLSLCDVLASSSASYATATWVHSARVVAWLLHSYFDRPGEAVAPPAVIDGTGLMAAFGLAPGRLIGQLLAAVAEAQAAGEVYSAQEALDYAGQLIPHLVEENYGAAAAHALGAQP